MTQTTHDPLLPAPRLAFLFTYRDLVAGKGYLATVVVRGRVLATERDGEGVWLEGVCPGGLAGGGQTFTEAHSDFRVAFTNVLSEIAQDVDGFDDFKKAVEAFFADTNAAAQVDWNLAVAEQTPVGKLAEQMKLSIEPATTQPFVDVALKEMEALTPSDNRQEFEPLLAAA